MRRFIDRVVWSRGWEVLGAAALVIALTLVALPLAGQYITKVYMEQGGDKLVVVSGGEIEVQSGGVVDVQSGATFGLPAGSIERADLAEEALAVALVIPVSDIRSDAGASLTAAETAGTFDITVGTNTILANGEVSDNETEVSVAYFQFALPAEYVAAGDITIRMPSALIKTGAPTDNGSTLDIAVYKQSDAGAVGSDLSTTTAAATYAALDTWYNKDFVITATGLVAGDVLNVKITATVIDSEVGGGTIVLNLAPPKILLDVKG